MSVGKRISFVIVSSVLWPGIGWSLPQAAVDRPPPEAAASGSNAADRIVGDIEDAALRELLEEVLERNPGIAAAEARARAAAQRAPQAKGLPDPVINLIAYVEPPQTRTGPQRYVASISQALPWLGRLDHEEQAALLAATAAEADVEAKRLSLVTESRRLYHEIVFLERYRRVNEEFRNHLLQHEEISRTRYATGGGLGQGVVKIQAAITGADRELLDIEARKVSLVAQLNGLRALPGSTPVRVGMLADVEELGSDAAAMFETARRRRPEVAAASARVSQFEALVHASEKGYKPDFRIGLTYAGVDRRDDMAGRLQPPEGNGDDIFGIQGGISIPIWGKKLRAGVQGAVELEVAAEAAKRDIIVGIEAAIDDLVQRLPLTWRQLRLVEDVMIVQAEQALELARAGYASGALNALDLLDAEHVLFEVHTAVARAKADHLVGFAKLEGAIGAPLSEVNAYGAP